MVNVISPREVVGAMEALVTTAFPIWTRTPAEIITVTEEERSMTEDESLDDVANSFGG